MMNSKEALEKILNHKCYEKESSCWDYVKTLFQEEVATIEQDLDRLEQLEKQLNDGTLSDGYHTFNDLYLQRMYLFATIVNQNKELAWKSLKHEDGELCFGGDWFIVGIDTPKGSYTYHYENKYWDLFQCQELEVGKKWDGHTSKDVDRLLSLHFNAFDQLEKQVITLIEEKKLYEKQIKNWSEKYETVEKELLKTKKDFKYSQTSSKNCYKKLKEKFLESEKENQELKEAISIMKAKLVPILLLQEVDTIEEYNEGLDDCDEYRLTQEEYELLKEVFGYE